MDFVFNNSCERNKITRKEVKVIEKPEKQEIREKCYLENANVFAHQGEIQISIRIMCFYCSTYNQIKYELKITSLIHAQIFYA